MRQGASLGVLRFLRSKLYAEAMRKKLLLGALFFSANTAVADEVVLKNGAVITGEARTQGETVVVKLDIGTVAFDKSEVQEIRESASPLAEFEARRAKLSAEDLAGHKALAEWAGKNNLETRAREMWRRVLELAPNDARAHQQLGHQQYQGRWLDEDEFMRARGYSKYFGEWLTADELQARELSALARRGKYKEAEATPEIIEAEPAEGYTPPTSDLQELEFYGWSPALGGSLYWGTNPYFWPQTHSYRPMPKPQAPNIPVRPISRPPQRSVRMKTPK